VRGFTPVGPGARPGVSQDQGRYLQFRAGPAQSGSGDRRPRAEPTTTLIFDEYEGFYNLLMKRVGEMAAQGKSLDEVKKELKMPEYADWHDQERLSVNIDAAYKSVKK
jgi:hypothetical protein